MNRRQIVSNLPLFSLMFLIATYLGTGCSACVDLVPVDLEEDQVRVDFRAGFIDKGIEAETWLNCANLEDYDFAVNYEVRVGECGADLNGNGECDVDEVIISTDPPDDGFFPEWDLNYGGPRGIIMNVPINTPFLIRVTFQGNECSPCCYGPGNDDIQCGDIRDGSDPPKCLGGQLRFVYERTFAERPQSGVINTNTEHWNMLSCLNCGTCVVRCPWE